VIGQCFKQTGTGLLTRAYNWNLVAKSNWEHTGIWLKLRMSKVWRENCRR